MKISLVLFLSLLSSSVITSETSGSSSQSGAQAIVASKLPHCVNSPDEIETIRTKIKANSKTENKYDGYKKALASDSDEELMARLIYSETLATNCDQMNTKVVPVIAAVIANRVKIKKGDVKSVVFQRDQFASSLNIYSESAYKDFLCPDDEALWALSLKEAMLALSDKAKPTDTVNYFLYKHSQRWTKEPWALQEDQTLTGASVRQCIKAFKNPSYK